VRDCPGERSTSAHADDDLWRVTVKTPRCRFELEMEGEIVFTDDETGIERMGRNAVFALEDRRPGGRRSLRIVAGRSGAPDWTWEVDGVERPADAAARAWLAEMIPTLFRTTGYQSEERTRRILARGGVDAVFTEIGLLGGDHVRRRYFIALLEATALGRQQLVRWIGLAGDTISSDYELASVLAHVPTGSLAAPDLQTAFVEAARTIDSDYEMRRTLTPLAENPATSPQVLDVIVELAADLESDYEMATLLTALADSYGADTPLPVAFFRATRSIDSDYELARTLKRALEHPLSGEALVGLLETARSIGSDYELASVLVAAAEGHRLEGPVRQAFDRALETVGGDYERDRVRRAVGS
jgi:hypothetical protein